MNDSLSGRPPGKTVPAKRKDGSHEGPALKKRFINCALCRRDCYLTGFKRIGINHSKTIVPKYSGQWKFGFSRSICIQDR